jgi:hypothetical protein
MAAFNRRALRPSHASPRGLFAGEGEQRPVRIKREPFGRLAWLGVGIFAKRTTSVGVQRTDDARSLKTVGSPQRAAEGVEAGNLGGPRRRGNPAPSAPRIRP